MVPPLLLGCQAHHAVLDMCAAPGSKTFQLLEALHAGVGRGGLPTGFVVANDADLKRCNLLTHQTKRAGSAGLVVTNHDASLFPDLRDGGPGGAPLKFDRVLADVPCTGDGTMRKAPEVWAKWGPMNAVGLHPLQLRIALRGARLLAVGGRMVYSTCSLNPIENEAVVAALLKEAAGALTLDDCAEELPQLRRLPGLRSWQVWDKNGRREGPDGVDAASAPLKPMRPSLFPDAASDALPLQRCLRVLPHHADTGGFFIARFTKHRPLPGEASPDDKDEASVPAPEEAGAPEAAAGAAAPERRRNHFAFIDPVVPVTDAKVLASIAAFYGLDPAFPLLTQTVTRVSESGAAGADAGAAPQVPRRLYVVTSGAAALLQSRGAGRLKVMAAGLKVFERGHDEQASAGGFSPFRLVHEGLHATLPHARAQRATIALRELTRLVRDRVLFFAEPTKPELPGRTTAPARFEAETAAALAPLSGGCCILVPTLSAAQAAGLAVESGEDLAVCAWKGAVSLSLLVAKPDAQHLLRQLLVLNPDMAPAKTGAEPEAAEAAE